jgi:hypothetical protein
MLVSLLTSSIWALLLGGVAFEGSLWTARQLTGAAPTRTWGVTLLGFSFTLTWLAIVKVSRQLELGRRLNSSFNSPTTYAALNMLLIAGSGVALWVVVGRYFAWI